jgi:urease beta subunit
LSEPGEILSPPGVLQLNEGRERVTLSVENQSPWPVGIGSHFHFFEVNRRLVFDRSRAYGMRLDAPAGAIVWFGAGEQRSVTLVPFRGARYVWGFNGLVNGPLDEERKSAFSLAREKGFARSEDVRG